MGIFGKEEPETIELNGKPLRCVVCQHATFYQRKAQLHGGVATFFDVEWASPTCLCLVCSECGYIHWFVPP
jgi:predicted nucleic-acid-binding Zn-ribbon protein